MPNTTNQTNLNHVHAERPTSFKSGKPVDSPTLKIQNGARKVVSLPQKATRPTVVR